MPKPGGILKEKGGIRMTKFYKILIITTLTINIIFIVLVSLHYNECKSIKAKVESFKLVMERELLKNLLQISADTSTSSESIKSDLKQEIDVIKAEILRMNQVIPVEKTIEKKDIHKSKNPELEKKENKKKEE